MPIGPPVTRGKEDSERSASTSAVQVAGGKLGIIWTVAYYMLLVGGAVAFYDNFWRLTDSTRMLASFGNGR